MGAHRVRNAVQVVVVVMAAVLTWGAASAAAQTAPLRSPALFNRTTLKYASKLNSTQEAQRYNVMVLESTEVTQVMALRAADPSLKILMSSNALQATPLDASGAASCTAYSNDLSENWFLRNQRGAPIKSASGARLMDVGNRAYQSACVAHALSLAKANGFNGVMFEGISAQTTGLVPTGMEVAKYPTASRWDAAMLSFLTYAGKAVRADHMDVMATLADTTGTLWRRWTAPLDGSEYPGWTDSGHGTVQQIPNWSAGLADDAWSEAHHKYALVDSENRTRAGNVYGLASMLLVAHGDSSYATDNTSIKSYEAWYPEYSYARGLGAATGPYTRLKNGVYERRFTDGIVLVNPSARAVRSFSLPKAYYNGTTKVSAVNMAQTTGFILLSKSTTPSSSTGYFGGASGSGSSAGGVPSGGSASGGSGSSASLPALGPSPALFNRITFDYSTTLSNAQEAARYQVMVLSATDASTAAALKAANPNLKILMYSMPLYSSPSDPKAIGNCTGYASDQANPSWFLDDQNGKPIEVGGSYLMDMGNSAYMQTCVTHAIAEAKADGFDGIMFDGLNSSWSWLVPSGTQVAKYPTATNSTEWDAAMQSFLNYAGQAVQASGLMVVANEGGTDTQLYQQWTTPLNGALQQEWTDAGLGLAQQAPSWSMNLANVAWSEANGKYALLNSRNRTEAGNVFGLASMLLVAAGYSSYSTSNNDFGSGEYWYPEYNDAQDLGSATGGYVLLSNGVYERRFQNGLVLVNPSTSSVSTFSLGGTYHGSTTSSTSSVSMPATSGLILLNGAD